MSLFPGYIDSSHHMNITLWLLNLFLCCHINKEPISSLFWILHICIIIHFFSYRIIHWFEQILSCTCISLWWLKLLSAIIKHANISSFSLYSFSNIKNQLFLYFMMNSFYQTCLLWKSTKTRKLKLLSPIVERATYSFALKSRKVDIMNWYSLHFLMDCFKQIVSLISRQFLKQKQLLAL